MNNFPVNVPPEDVSFEYMDDEVIELDQVKHAEQFMWNNWYRDTYKLLFTKFFRFLLENNITNTKKLEESLTKFHYYLKEE